VCCSDAGSPDVVFKTQHFNSRRASKPGGGSRRETAEERVTRSFAGKLTSAYSRCTQKRRGTECPAAQAGSDWSHNSQAASSIVGSLRLKTDPCRKAMTTR